MCHRTTALALLTILLTASSVGCLDESDPGAPSLGPAENPDDMGRASDDIGTTPGLGDMVAPDGELSSPRDLADGFCLVARDAPAECIDNASLTFDLETSGARLPDGTLAGTPTGCGDDTLFHFSQDYRADDGFRVYYAAPQGGGDGQHPSEPIALDALADALRNDGSASHVIVSLIAGASRDLETAGLEIGGLESFSLISPCADGLALHLEQGLQISGVDTVVLAGVHLRAQAPTAPALRLEDVARAVVLNTRLAHEDRAAQRATVEAEGDTRLLLTHADISGGATGLSLDAGATAMIDHSRIQGFGAQGVHVRPPSASWDRSSWSNAIYLRSSAIFGNPTAPGEQVGVLLEGGLAVLDGALLEGMAGSEQGGTGVKASQSFLGLRDTTSRGHGNAGLWAQGARVRILGGEFVANGRRGILLEGTAALEDDQILLQPQDVAADSGLHNIGERLFPADQSFFPSGQMFLPGETFPGQSFFPSGQMFFPSGQMFFPSGQMFFPSGQMFFPSGQMFGMDHWPVGAISDGTRLSRNVRAGLEVDRAPFLLLDATIEGTLVDGMPLELHADSISPATRTGHGLWLRGVPHGQVEATDFLRNQGAGLFGDGVGIGGLGGEQGEQRLGLQGAVFLNNAMGGIYVRNRSNDGRQGVLDVAASTFVDNQTFGLMVSGLDRLLLTRSTFTLTHGQPMEVGAETYATGDGAQILDVRFASVSQSTFTSNDRHGCLAAHTDEIWWDADSIFVGANPGDEAANAKIALVDARLCLGDPATGNCPTNTTKTNVTTEPMPIR